MLAEMKCKSTNHGASFSPVVRSFSHHVACTVLLGVSYKESLFLAHIRHVHFLWLDLRPYPSPSVPFGACVSPSGDLFAIQSVITSSVTGGSSA